MIDSRKPMSPEDFDAACRALWRRVPGLSETSGRRSEERNKQVGGNPLSKHRIGMARDFVGSPSDMTHGAAVARILGLWFYIHDAGSGTHLHVSGLPVGELPEDWVIKYGAECGIVERDSE